MNKYLEKIALNASKARAFAKAVGVIPDHLTQWKYAIRNLKDPRGNPLAGEALESARIRMGGMSNSAFQEAKKHHIGHGSQEIGFGISRGGKINTDIVKGEGDSIRLNSIGDSMDSRMVHTHGYFKGNSQGSKNPRLAFQSAPNPYLERTIGKSTPVGRVARGPNGKLQLVGNSKDVALSIAKPHEKIGPARISKHNVLAPDIDVEGVHRNVGTYDNKTGILSALKRRTVLFKHD